jgi:YD repeat-containing protein
MNYKSIVLTAETSETHVSSRGRTGRAQRAVSASVVLSLVCTQVIGVMPASAAVSIQSLSVPQYVQTMTAGASPAQSAGTVALGATRGDFSVDESGDAHYSVPLQLVPGTSGFTPSLSFEYSSQAGNGTMGVGFAVGGLSAITRCGSDVADDGQVRGVELDSQDHFCLDGGKLVLVAGTYGSDGAEYRTRPDRHLRVRSFGGSTTTGPSYFVVDTGNGVQQYYGRKYNGAPDAVTIVSNGSSKNVAWAISHARDGSSNAIHYDYVTRTGPNGEIERSIATMRYGRQNAPDRQVRFDYDTRPDAAYGYRFGAPWELTKRLKSVSIEKLVDGSWLPARSYTLAYEQETATGVSMLDMLTECGSVSTECKRPTRLGWQHGTRDFMSKVKQSIGLPQWGSSVQVMTADLNGDGRLDYAYPGASAQPWRYVLSQSNPAQPNDHYTVAVDGGPTGLAGPTSRAYTFDYNLDGLVDLIPRVGTLGGSDPKWQPHLSKLPATSGGSFSVVVANTDFVGPLNQLAEPSGALFGDFNGDGLQDNIEGSYDDQIKAWRYWLRMRTGTVSNSVDINEPSWNGTPCDNQALTPPCDTQAFQTKQQATEYSFGGKDPGKLWIVDVNGDGRDEVLTQGNFSTTHTLIAYRMDGSTAIDTGLPNALIDSAVTWADLNGDGLIDLVAPGAALPAIGLGYFLNTGRGFVGPLPMNILISDAAAKALQVADVDGDGRNELLVPRLSSNQFTGLNVVRSTVGAGGQLSFEVSQPEQLNFHAQLDTSGDELFTQGVRVGDVDGDGQADVIVFVRGGDTPEGVYLFKHAGVRPGLLTSVRENYAATDNFKPTVEVVYTPITDASVYARGQCDRREWRSCAFGAAKYVVKTMRTDAGLNASSAPAGQAAAQNVSDYSYTTGRYDRSNNRFVGFAEQRITSYASAGPTRKVVVRRFYDQSEAGHTPTLTEQWRATRVQVTGQPERIAWERERFDWRKIEPEHTYFDVINVTQVDQYDLPVSAFSCGGVPDCLGVLSPVQVSAQLGAQQPLRSSTTTVNARDLYGNVTQEVTTYGPGMPDDKSVFSMTPALDLSAWLIHRPGSISVFEKTRNARTELAPTQSYTTTINYWPSSSGVNPSLPQTVVRSAPDAPETLTTSYSYTPEGNVERITAMSSNPQRAPRETTFRYDPHGYLYAVRSGFEDQTTYTGFNPITGQLQVEVDLNGVGTDYTYDTLGRLLEIRRLQKPRAPAAGVKQRFAYSYQSLGGESVLQVESSDDTGALSRRLIDRGGRTVRERFKGFDGQMRDRRRSYDAFGRLIQATTYKPVSSTAQDDTVNYSYDALDRLVQVSDPLVVQPSGPPKSATRTWSYEGLSAVRTDDNSNKQRSTYDPRGRLIASIDAENAPSERVMRVYGYAPFDRLATTDLQDVPDVLASRMTYSYDAFGNLLSQQDVERGAKSYQYNAFDERVSSSDASGRVRTYDYDVLGRMLSEVVTTQAGSGSSRTFTYDHIEGPGARTTLGALLRAQVTGNVVGGAQHTSDYSYDQYGRLTTRDYTLPSDLQPGSNETLHFESSYDALDRVNSLTFPLIQGLSLATKIFYSYSPASSSNGQLKEVSAYEQLITDTAPHATTLWQAKATDPQNRLSEYQLGSMRTVNAFDWRGRMLSTEALTVDEDQGNSNVHLQHFKYVYDGEGNVSSRTDMQQGMPGVGVTEFFGYDHMDRIAALSMDQTKLASAPDDNFKYDKFGNLTSSIRRGSYTFDPIKPTQVTRVSGGTVDSRPLRSYHYDVLGRQDSRPDGTLTYNDCDLQATFTPVAGAKPSASSYLYDATCTRVRRASAAESVTYAEGLERHLDRATGNVEYRLNVGGAVLRYLQSTSASQQ